MLNFHFFLLILKIRAYPADAGRLFRTSLTLKVLSPQIAVFRASASAFEKAFAGAP
jgi:hypothetical protein